MKRWKWLLVTTTLLAACGDGGTSVVGGDASGPDAPPGDGTAPGDVVGDVTPGDGPVQGDGPGMDGTTPDDTPAPGDGGDAAPGDGPGMDGAPGDGGDDAAPGDGGDAAPGDGGDGGDGGDRCVPEMTRICYAGPAGTIGVGRCRGGTQTCNPSGTWSACTGEVLPAMEETCGNAMDDNCNGVSDEGCGECTAGMTRPCYSGAPATADVGRCRGGMQTCDAMGRWPMACGGEVLPLMAETCGNMTDDDCNGMVDDGCGDCTTGEMRSCYTGPAGTRGVGRCQEGSQTCGADRRYPTACAGEVLPSMETCGNGMDDDCDGMTDEGCGECVAGTSRPCYTGAAGTVGVGRCRGGTQVCGPTNMYATECTGQVTPAMSEACGNMIDDDCDGMTDEGCGECMPGTTRMCYSGPSGTRDVGRCRGGTQLCGPTGMYDVTCLGEAVPAMGETCGNMVDDDCNGMVDDGCGECSPGATRPCYTGASGTQSTGACRQGTQTCGAGRTWPSTCAGEVVPASETCDNVDNDCDGMTDEEPAATACRLSNATAVCRTGACAVGACSAGYGDCDSMASTGCETDLATSAAHCGACGRACAAGQSCVAGNCTGALGGDLALGESHSCALLPSGELACWGLNSSGQLGDGTTVNRAHPALVRNLTNVVDVELGATHSCAVRASGETLCWGANALGQLGDGTTAARSLPGPVFSLSDATQVVIGAQHTCVLRRTGRVACWGQNNVNQLGDGGTANRTIPIDIAGLTGVVQVAAGANHTCALRLDGTVACWGQNANGQLGDATTTNRAAPVTVPGLTNVVTISAGQTHTCAIARDGSVRCWGYNGYGGLGDGTTTQRTSPVVVPTVTDAVQISAGRIHTCIRRRGSTLMCWGYNGYGQIGDGSTANRALPVILLAPDNVQRVVAGGNHTCARIATGEVRCWGLNNYGQLGDGSTTNATSARPPVFGLGGAMTCSGAACTLPIAGGNDYNCLVRPSGSLACWGYNANGGLGDGTTVVRYGPVNSAPAVTGVTSVALGANHTCARVGSGAVSCWGRNDYGQLGNATTAASPTPVTTFGVTDAAQVAATSLSTCARRATGAIVCWGYNAYGQLGDGSTTNRTVTGPVGGASPVTDATAIDADGHTVCALRGAGGAVNCWGYNNYGQVGDGSTTNRPLPTAVRAVGGAAGSSLTGVEQVAVGDGHACALRMGLVICWGRNTHGQIGDGTSTNRSTPVLVPTITDAVEITAGALHTCARRATGAVMCWGYNGYGNLGDGSTTNRPLPVTVGGLTDVATITAGTYHTCARRADGSTYCWGYNNNGQLGNGWTVNASVPQGPIFGLP